MAVQIHGRQFPTRSRARKIGRLRYTVSYGFPGRNGVAVSLCWDPKPEHDVRGVWQHHATYKVDLTQVGEVIAAATSPRKDTPS